MLGPAQVDAAQAIHDLTGGAGVDVAIEVSGAYAALATAILVGALGTGDSVEATLRRRLQQDRKSVV